MKTLDTSTKKYNLWNWKATMRQLRVRININKLWVHIILRAKKILWAHLKWNKSHGMFIFVFMNVVKKYVLQPPNAHAQHSKQPSVRSNKCWSCSIMIQRDYVTWTDNCELILIDVIRNQKDVQRIRNSVLHISITLLTLPPIVIV